MSDHTLLVVSIVLNVLLVLIAAHYRQLLIGAKRREERTQAKYAKLWEQIGTLQRMRLWRVVNGNDTPTSA